MSTLLTRLARSVLGHSSVFVVQQWLLLGDRRQVHRIDDAMMANGRVQPCLEDVDPKDYARLRLSVVRPGELIGFIGYTAVHAEPGEQEDLLERREP